MTDDGSPAPENINIQTACGAQSHTVAHPTPSGDFVFQWANATPNIFEDASESGRMPGTTAGSGTSSITGNTTGSTGTSAGGGSGHLIDPMAVCELRAEASGYTSTRASLYDRGGQETFDIGVITLHRIAADDGRTVSLLSLKAPKEAKKSFDKGTSLAAANKPVDAAVNFQKAVAIYPEYADAWVGLGLAESQAGSREAARADFQKAMELDEKLVTPWQELGYLASDESRWADAVRYLDRAVRLDPMSSAKAWYFDAVAHYNSGHFDLAERSVRAEMKLDRNPRAEYLLGLVLIARKDTEGGAAAMRAYLQSWPNGDDAESAKRQLGRLQARSE